MYYSKRLSRKNGDEGISPVVGVMLMLVVTIIIAAVVSAFAGGAVSGTKKAPSATIEFHIKNGGSTASSYFSMKVLGTSEPIDTKDLKLITAWVAKDMNASASTYGSAVTGGATSSAGAAKAKVASDKSVGSDGISVPTGYGTGVIGWANDTSHPVGAQWGNFSLGSGSSTFDRPVGYGSQATTSPHTTQCHDHNDGTFDCDDGWTGITDALYNSGDNDPEHATCYDYSPNYLTATCTYTSASGTSPTYMYPDINGKSRDPMQAILGDTWYNLRAGDTVSVRLQDGKSGKMIVDQKVIVEG